MITTGPANFHGTCTWHWGKSVREKGLRIIKQLRDIAALEKSNISFLNQLNLLRMGGAKSKSLLQKKQKQDHTPNIVASNGKVQKLNTSYQIKRETGIILKINGGNLR